MISGQDLLRGHNGMLTWVTCAPSTEALTAFYGPSHQIQASLRSSDGSTLLTNKEAILQRWSERSEASKLGRFRNIFGNVCITENISTLLSCLRVIEGLPS